MNNIVRTLLIIFVLLFLAVGIIMLTFVAGKRSSNKADGNQQESGEVKVNKYTQISMDEAKKIFEAKKKGDYVIVDVRRADEFAEGHIPNSINIANESIETTPPKQLVDKNQIIYIYCRSGNRSKQAAQKLVDMGYTNIIEFGGIIDWTGEVEK